MISWILLGLSCAALVLTAVLHIPVLRIARQRKLAKGIAVAIEHRSPFKLGSSDQLEKLVSAVGQRLGMNSKELERLRTASLVCDLGLCSVPSELLRKTEEWTPLEQGVYDRHAATGANILKSNDLLSEFAPIVRFHHARFETNVDAPIESRIISVCSDYLGLRQHVGKDRAVVALERQSGFHYEPKVVVAVKDVISREP